MRGALASLMTLTTLLFCLLPSAAHAADELDLSWDGQTWSKELSQPMFDAMVDWVPGDVETASFYVRNQGDSGANLTVAVVTRDEDGLLRFQDIKLAARIGAEEWVSLESTEKNFRLNSGALPAGEARKVEVRAQFDLSSPNRSQLKQLALNFRVTLSEAQGSPEDPGPGEPQPTGPGHVDDGNDGSLPNSGAPAVGWVIVAAGIAVGSGLTLIRRSKREEVRHDTQH